MKFPHPLYILLFTATATFAVNGFLVYKAVSEKRDLVTRNYYQESLQYDEWRSQRENARDKGLEFSLDQVGSQWRISVKRSEPAPSVKQGATLSAKEASDAPTKGKPETTSADEAPATALENTGTPDTREGTAENAGSTVFGDVLQSNTFQDASLNFYRPGDQNLDHKLSLHMEGDNLVANARPLASGAWRVTLSLQLEDTRLAQDFELMM